MGGDCLRDGPDLSPWREEDRPFVRDAGFKAVACFFLIFIERFFFLRFSVLLGVLLSFFF